MSRKSWYAIQWTFRAGVRHGSELARSDPDVRGEAGRAPLPRARGRTPRSSRTCPLGRPRLWLPIQDHRSVWDSPAAWAIGNRTLIKAGYSSHRLSEPEHADVPARVLFRTPTADVRKITLPLRR